MESKILTVCLITYNHEKYLKQALDSILMQQTQFEWDLVIADDCSKDSTRQILLDYKNQYPDKIHLLLQEKNVGPAQNFVDLILFPKSKYIAYLEGDDYWTDPQKLQKQVDFLEQNDSFVLVHTNVVGLLGDEFIDEVSMKRWNLVNDELKINDALVKPIAFSCTSLFRNINFKEFFDEKFIKLKAGDWGFWVILLKFGNSKFINEKTAVYRINVGVSNKEENHWVEDYYNRFRFLFAISFRGISKKTWIILKVSFFYLIKYLKYKIKKGLRNFKKNAFRL